MSEVVIEDPLNVDDKKKEDKELILTLGHSNGHSGLKTSRP